MPAAMTRRRFGLLAAAQVVAPPPDRLTVLLDWFINPDHAPILVAQRTGAFTRRNLAVELVAPADGGTGPRLAASGHGDIALTDEPHFHEQIAGGLQLLRIGALINRPLSTLVTLRRGGILSVAALRGKRIGQGAGDAERAMVGAILATAGLTLGDVQMIDVGAQLAVSLLTGRVDAVTVYRNFETLELREHGAEPVQFDYETHGVPWFDEMIFVCRAGLAGDARLPRFLAAVAEGAARLRADPEGAWRACSAAQPDLDTKLNHAAWNATVPYFASDPFAMDRARYTRFADFLAAGHIIAPPPPVTAYTRVLRSP
jgi:putative hydroxymethylpyrimidine transport system substrate-binding protein